MSDQKNRKASSWPQTLQYICARLIDNGLGALLILGGVVIAIAGVVFQGMNSADRKDTIMAVLGWPGLTVLGWFIAFAEFFIFRYIWTLRERMHDNEIQRESSVKNVLMQEKFPFELQTSSEAPKPKQ